MGKGEMPFLPGETFDQIDGMLFENRKKSK